MNIILGIIRWLLFPVACLYGIITGIRNWVYDKGLLRSYTFPVPTVVIGNLTVGGTGKTPHTEYLIRLLKDHYSLVTLSRGYGRKTKGFRWATPESTAQQIGDEPLQFYRKFGNEIRVSVGEDRVAAMRQIISECGIRISEGGFANSISEIPKTPLSFGEGSGVGLPSEIRIPNSKVFLLDDAYQHRPIQPSLKILLTDYNRLFYKDFLLPTGNLRESRRGAGRADVLIVSKCRPDLSESEKQAITQRIRSYLKPGVPVFFTSVRYGTPVGFDAAHPTISDTRVLGVSGIAQPQIFEQHLSRQFDLQHHLVFGDHHDYTPANVARIKQTCEAFRIHTVLTTEKDFVKLAALPLPTDVHFFYVPIAVYFLFEEEKSFQTRLLQAFDYGTKPLNEKK